jgi:hypothetical protein
MAAEDAFQKLVKAFDQPLDKVLRPVRYLIHAARRQAREDNQERGHDPGHQHRVGDGESQGSGDFHGAL